MEGNEPTRSKLLRVGRNRLKHVRNGGGHTAHKKLSRSSFTDTSFFPADEFLDQRIYLVGFFMLQPMGGFLKFNQFALIAESHAGICLLGGE